MFERYLGTPAPNRLEYRDPFQVNWASVDAAMHGVASWRSAAWLLPPWAVTTGPAPRQAGTEGEAPRKSLRNGMPDRPSSPVLTASTWLTPIALFSNPTAEAAM